MKTPPATANTPIVAPTPMPAVAVELRPPDSSLPPAPNSSPSPPPDEEDVLSVAMGLEFGGLPPLPSFPLSLLLSSVPLAGSTTVVLDDGDGDAGAGAGADVEEPGAEGIGTAAGCSVSGPNTIRPVFRSSPMT
jgi:hypothetical protein